MKKIMITNPFEVQILDVPIPKVGEQELLIKTEISGVSAGTEMMLYRGTYPNFAHQKWAQWKKYPVAPGYELVGTVVEVGSGNSANSGGGLQIDALGPAAAIVKTNASEFRVGDRVICLGEHAEYVNVPAVMAAKVPDSVASDEATLAVLATTAMHCIRRAEMKYGDTVAVIGCGILGYLVMQHARINGARRVIVVDPDESRLKIAQDTNADTVINPTKQNAIEAVKESNGGILADVVIEASGYKGTVRQAMELTRDRGRIVVLGWHTDDVTFEFGEFYTKELTMVASQAIGPEAGLPYSYVRWSSDQSLKWAIELIAEGKITGRHFRPTHFPFTDVEKVYQMIDKRNPLVGIQTILDW